MPRFSPPTATGLPRRRGSAACSTEAKKASASRWTMERASMGHKVPWLLALADQRDHDALDLKFFLGDEAWITGVLRAQIGSAAVQEEGFEGDLAVNEA